ncbi:MAG: serine--tRNA ligase, partial [Planctomycetota bacterium]|nr:serine--tRNA ligase [Planctomycetota bacterium]
MLDLKWVRENPEIVQDAARRKRIQVDVGALIDADAQHRALLAQVEQMRADLKASSKALGKLAPEEREVALAGQKEKKGNLKQLESEEGVLREKVQELALLLPMPPADDVPDGKDDLENLEIRNSGSVPELGFEPKSHVELGEYLGIVDIPRGVRIAG